MRAIKKAEKDSVYAELNRNGQLPAVINTDIWFVEEEDEGIYGFLLTPEEAENVCFWNGRNRQCNLCRDNADDRCPHYELWD